MKRKLTVAAFIIAAIFSLSSCTATLKVESVDYPGLKKMKAAEPDDEAIRNWHYPDLTPYFGYYASVSITDQGKLLVSNRSSGEIEEVKIMKGNNNYFVGTNLGEFGGWVRMFSYYEDLLPGDTGAPVDVVHENCVGFIKIDNDNGYFITTRYNPDKLSTFEDDGVIYRSTDSKNEIVVYKLTLPPDMSGWMWEEVGIVDGYAETFIHDEKANIVYIVSETALWEFSLENYTSRFLDDLSQWYNTGAKSIVKLDGKLYIGMSMGIYEYDIAADESLWYPMDFEKYVEN